MICVGLNYRDHAIESNMEMPEGTDASFRKFGNARDRLLATNIVLPKNSAQPDYEAEFAFVIGKPVAATSPAENWQEHVFGYTMLNDVSARDVQLATTQWMMGKTSTLSRPWDLTW